jgi:hypothetical protein
MSKLTEKQIELAKKLLADNPNETAIYVKTENGHMYFDKQNALHSVAGKEEALEVITAVAKKADPPKSDAPDGTWKVKELKAFAAEKGIDLGDAKKQEEILEKVLAAIAAPPAE